MYALTLYQPWADAIIHCGKRIENRFWKPPTRVMGQRIALHAGAHIDRDGRCKLQDSGFSLPAKVVTRAIVGTVIVADCIDSEQQIPKDQLEQLIWWSGPYGWLLKDVHELPEPVPCRGYQKLWRLPHDIEAQVRRQEHKTAERAAQERRTR